MQNDKTENLRASHCYAMSTNLDASDVVNRPEPDPNRPYPSGIAWDEAWRQRQRADNLQERFDQLRKIAISQVQCFEVHAEEGTYPGGSYDAYQYMLKKIKALA